MRIAPRFPLLAALAGLLAFPVAHAQDLLIDNYSFETGDETGWTEVFHTGASSTSIDHAVTGSYSLKIADASSTTTYGVESTKLAAGAQFYYRGFVKVYLTTGASVQLIVHFYNSSGTLLGYTASPIVSSPLNQWQAINVIMLSPAGTTQMDLCAFSTSASVGTSYWDDFLVTRVNTTVGTVVENVSNLACALGPKGTDGTTKDTLYFTETGSPSGVSGQLVAVDVNTLAVTGSFALPGMTGAWGCTAATDGTIYVGDYTSNVAGAHVFQYTPGVGDTPIDLGQSVSGDTDTFTLCPGPSASVYGGNYLCHLFKYTPGSGFSLIGGNPFQSGNDYVRGLAYNAATGVIYVGTGTNAHLRRYVVSTGGNTEILPTAYQSQEFPYGISISGTKVFCLMVPSFTYLVLNDNGDGTARLDATFPGGAGVGGGVSPAVGSKVYYNNGGVLYSYDMVAKTTASTGFALPPSSTNIHIWTSVLTDQANWPGTTIVGSSRNQVWRYNVQNGTGQISTPAITPLASQIGALGLGPTKKIHAGGEVVGGFGTYTSMRSDLTLASQTGIGQVEGMATLGNLLYIGVYPQAFFYSYDPTLSWNVGANPLEITTLYGDNQDRPGAMTAELTTDRVYFGTQPSTGQVGGSFNIYQVSDGSVTTYLSSAFKATDQCIVSMTNYNGVVYAGTSIEAGPGGNPTQTSAKLVTCTVSNSAFTSVALPFSYLTAVNAMTVGPDNKIWMLAGNGYLFIYNPSGETWDYSAQLFSNVSNHGGRDSMVLGKDGQIYATLPTNESTSGIFFRIDPSSKATTILYTGTLPSYATQDEYGNIYYSDGSDLHRYSTNLALP